MPMSADQLARMRRAVGEPDDTNGYTDQVLHNIFDQNGQNFNATAADVWDEKAARAAHLVDVSEGPSSRKMSQLHDHALKMVERYGGAAAPGTDTQRRPRTRPIRRA